MDLRGLPFGLRPAGLGLGALLLVSCAGLPRIDEDQLAWARRRYPDLTREALDGDRSLYAQKCGGCHRPHAPGEYSSQAWESRYLPEMARRAKLSPEERESVSRFVLGLSGKPSPAP